MSCNLLQDLDYTAVFEEAERVERILDMLCGPPGKVDLLADAYFWVENLLAACINIGKVDGKWKAQD